MTARTRRTLTAVAVLWFAVVVWSLTVLPVSLPFNALLASLVVPMVWLLGSFARASAHQHANRWARDIEKVHSAGRPRPLPHQEAATR
jgi:hypothetical protein